MQSQFLRVVLLITSFYFSSSCTHDVHDQEWEKVFKKWEARSPERLISTFKNEVIDDSGAALVPMSSIIDSIYRDATSNEKLSLMFDSLFGLDSVMKKAYIGILFHDFLNDIHRTDSIAFRTAAIISDAKSDAQLRQYDSINERIAEENYGTIDIGDTIKLVLPVDSADGKKYTFFYSGYPYSNDYSNAYDSLSLTVAVENKSYGEKSDGSTDSTCLSFRVRVLTTDNADVEVEPGRLYSTGDYFEFCLQNYGRPIGSVNRRQ